MMAPPMQFNPGLHGYQPNPVLIKAGINLGVQQGEKKKFKIPTWLIVLIVILFIGVVGLVWWLL